MTTLLFSAIGFCAFTSVTMAITSIIDFSNKDFKLNKKQNGKGVVNDEIESFNEEVAKQRKVH